MKELELLIVKNTYAKNTSAIVFINKLNEKEVYRVLSVFPPLKKAFNCHLDVFCSHTSEIHTLEEKMQQFLEKEVIRGKLYHLKLKLPKRGYAKKTIKQIIKEEGLIQIDCDD